MKKRAVRASVKRITFADERSLYASLAQSLRKEKGNPLKFRMRRFKRRASPPAQSVL